MDAKLLPAVITSAQAPSTSSSSPALDQYQIEAAALDQYQIEAQMKKLMSTLEQIKATLYEAEQRVSTDLSVKLWLKELERVAYDADDALNMYQYEVLRARKMKLIEEIRSIFDMIVNDGIALQLSEGDRPEHCNDELQIAKTSQFVVQSNIFGREREKESLIDLLSTECDDVSVVAIVGMGGIGKTTLAQLAYNDERIRQNFDIFGWISVSKDFNVERLTKELVESITRNECGLTHLSALHEQIWEEVSGKRVLLVLDNVSNVKKSFWSSFQAPFMSTTFVKILVTTRNNNVAQIMQAKSIFNLGCLSAKQCWRLFEHHAFGGVEQNKNPKLVEIGKQIMNKCGMLPLAVKSIANLLRHEAEEVIWRDILESELWDSNAGNEIFPFLEISYACLPTTETMCTPPNKKVKRRIKSWSKGKQLGGGSFGMVYEAISDEGFFFAVKEVLIYQGTNAQQCITQLEQEIALLSQFEHENIVQYYGTDKEETKLYIFLELMTQGSIASLYQNYHLQDTHVSEYTRQILYGLVYLHERNIVHRDIKCANILVHANGSVKLADFGLAKKMTKINILKSTKGSVYWMAPEVVNPKKTYGLKADIWSLGCTVLEMLTRQIPYPNIEWIPALFKIGRGDQPPIPNYLSIEAQDFITQCVRVNPDERPSAVELLEHPFVKIPLPLLCSPPASQS